jgi:uncharacterized protein (DUF302 family)
MSQDGLVTIPSIHTVRETIDRFAEGADAAGLRIFGRVDHAAGAAEVEMPLRPTELIIFGHPRSGTPLMQDQQTAGIDLPLKALAWEDGEGKVWLTYNDAGWLARRHGLGPGSDPSIEAIGAAVAELAAAAIG